MPRTTLHLIRHGEAADHDEASDPGLSLRGEAQASEVARRLESSLGGNRVGAVLHSSRRRAAATAEIVAAAIPGAVARWSDDLEDRTPVPRDFAGVPERYHRLLREATDDERDIGGRRLDAAVRSLGEIGEHDRMVVAVTHAFVVGWFVSRVLETPSWRWVSLPVSNGSLTVLQWETGREPRVLAFNDTGHLS